MRLSGERKPINRHGLSSTRLYHRWTAMVSRITDPDNKCYRTYGGRGIGICEDWRDFLKFRDWAFASGYKPELIIDRINVNGDYCPDNCRWVTKSDSSINRRKKDDFGINKGKKSKRVTLTIVRNRCHFYLGTYPDIESAKLVRGKFIELYNKGELDNCQFIKSAKRYVA